LPDFTSFQRKKFKEKKTGQIKFNDKALQDAYLDIKDEFEGDTQTINNISEDIKTLENYLSRFSATSSLPVPIGQGNLIRWDVRKKRIIYFHKDKTEGTRNLIETPKGVRLLAASQLPRLLKSMIDAKNIGDYPGYEHAL